MRNQWMIAVAGTLAMAAGVAHAADGNRIDPADTLVNGDRISVEVMGKGPDIVLIPGLASSRLVWARTAQRLKDRYRLHIVQVNGFAGAPAGANATGPVVMPVIAAIDAYIHSAHLTRPMVVGHSLGGLMALGLAVHHGDDISRAFIVDTLPFYGELMGGPTATADQVKPFADMMATQIEKADDATMRAQMDKMAAGMATAPADQATIVGWTLASNRHALGAAMAEDMTMDGRPMVAAIKVPVTVIYEAPLKPLVEKDYAPVANRTLIAEPDGVKHFIMYDDPKGFDAALDRFLAG